MSEKARQYACGLMQAGTRKNMDRMAEVIPNTKSRNLQQFLTHSKWNARDVMDHVAFDANELLGHESDTGFLIDESSFEKQGKGSVGVSRQWLGRFGKVDNGQVAVFSALAWNHFVTPVDVRLYLPEEWTNDPERCQKAGIPETEIKFYKKPELALQMVKHARQNGLRFGWVGADAGYGKGPGFCIALDEMSETFLVDVHSDFGVYVDDPMPYVPQKAKGRGRTPVKYQTKQESIEAKKLIATLSPRHWRVMKLRDTTRGQLTVRAARLKVYVWDGESERTHRWQLVVTKTLDNKRDIKISLTNYPPKTSLRRLAFRQRQRYWIERTFEDAKSECGMADYQVRKWQAWHHHMALVMMAMLFMLTERIKHKETCPMLTCADIEYMLEKFLPRCDLTEEEVFLHLEKRHRERQRAIDSHARRQRIGAG